MPKIGYPPPFWSVLSPVGKHLQKSYIYLRGLRLIMQFLFFISNYIESPYKKKARWSKWKLSFLLRNNEKLSKDKVKARSDLLQCSEFKVSLSPSKKLILFTSRKAIYFLRHWAISVLSLFIIQSVLSKTLKLTSALLSSHFFT